MHLITMHQLITCHCTAAYGMKALMVQTFVDEVFGGTLVSTVRCADCANVSIMREGGRESMIHR